MKRPQPQLPTASWGCAPEANAPERQAAQQVYPATTTTREGEGPTSRLAGTSRVRLISELEIPTRATQALARQA